MRLLKSVLFSLASLLLLGAEANAAVYDQVPGGLTMNWLLTTSPNNTLSWAQTVQHVVVTGVSTAGDNLGGSFDFQGTGAQSGITSCQGTPSTTGPVYYAPSGVSTWCWARRTITGPTSSTPGFGTIFSDASGKNITETSVLRIALVSTTSTDNATALQTAIDNAVADGGGFVYVPAGVYSTGLLTMYSGVCVVGAGQGATTLKLKNGANTALFQSYQFASLTGTNSLGGIGQFCIRDMTLDGNKANNMTAGYGMQIYGWDYRLDNLAIHDFKTDGIYSEWSSSGSCPTQGTGSTPAPNCMETYFTNLTVHDNDSYNIEWKGPHDSYGGNIIMYNAGIAGFKGSGISLVNTHSWGASQQYAYWLDGVTNIENSQAEGASIAQIYFAPGSNGSVMNNMQVFACPATGGVPTADGIKIGTSGGGANNVSLLHIANTNMTDCQIDFAGDGGKNKIVAAVYSASAFAATLGTPATTTDDLEIRASGSVTGSLKTISAPTSDFSGGIAAGGNVETAGTLAINYGQAIKVLNGGVDNYTYPNLMRVAYVGGLGDVLYIGASGNSAAQVAFQTVGTTQFVVGTAGCPSCVKLNSTSQLQWDNGAGTADIAIFRQGPAQIGVVGIPSTTGATTGYLCGTSSSGSILPSIDPTNTCLVSLEEDKNDFGEISPLRATYDTMMLRPFWGNYKNGADKGHIRAFFGAHQVEGVDKRLAAYGADGKLRSVQYDGVMVVLLSSVKVLWLAVLLLVVSNIGAWYLLMRRKGRASLL